MKGKFFKTSDRKNIYFEVTGTGPPILLIPGFLCTTRFFDRNVQQLSEKYQVIVMDPRGFGNSSNSPEGMNLHRMAMDIKELIEYLSLTDINLLGWSMGGNIAMCYYEQFGPYRLSSIGTIDSTLFPYGEGSYNAHNLAHYNLERFHTQMTHIYADYMGYCREFSYSLFKRAPAECDIEWIVKEAVKCPPHCAVTLYEDFVHQNCEHVLPEISIPMLICAADSPRTPKGIEMAKYYCSLVQSECIYHEFSDGGHILFYECPEEFNQAVMDFIGGRR